MPELGVKSGISGTSYDLALNMEINGYSYLPLQTTELYLDGSFPRSYELGEATLVGPKLSCGCALASRQITGPLL